METNLRTERGEGETTATYLNRLKEMGFLFHGSSNDNIEQLEPRYAYDRYNEVNTDTAVFATDNVTLTVIFGVYGGHKGWSTHTKKGQVFAKIPLRDKELLENTRGTVYVLPKKVFEKIEGTVQYKSHETVKPVTKVSVSLNDYYDLGGKIEWS